MKFWFDFLFILSSLEGSRYVHILFVPSLQVMKVAVLKTNESGMLTFSSEDFTYVFTERVCRNTSK